MRCCTRLIILFLVSAAVVQIRSQAPWKVEFASKYELKFFDETAANFDGAKSLCSENDGNVIRLDDVEVREKVYSVIPSAANVEFFWIGATGTLQNWIWLGQASTADTDFIIWNPGQPDNYGGSEHNLIIRKIDNKYVDVGATFEYAGTICQRRIDQYCETHTNACNNRETCTSTLSSPFFSCQCMVGYYGDTCSEQYCVAHPNTCSHGGSCTSTLTSPFFSCGCTDGYYGDTCSEQYCAAHPNKCSHGGSCISTFTSSFFTCQCMDGYYGDTCSEQYCAVHPNTCSHGGSCTSTLTSSFFTCQCTDGYYGNTCSEQFCAAHPNTCSHGGSCTSTLTSPFFSCQCTDGYYGDTCSEQYCAAHPNICSHGGTCTSTLTTPFFSCRCSDGYYGDACSDQYCAAHPNTCKNSGVCTSTLTSPFFTCQCTDGYYGDICTEKYCAAHPNTCSHGGTCTSTSTSPFFSCQCTDGYYGDTCTKQYCVAHPNTCSHGGDCTSTLTSPFFSCECTDGYYGDTCTERYCAAHPNTCKNIGVCTSTLTSPFFTCRCTDGYYGDICSERYCAAHPNTCKNIGVCTSTLTSPFFTCQCTDGYYGDICTQNFCAAHPNTCSHGGDCTSTLTSSFYSCRCTDGYYGDTCAEQYCTAHRDTCKNKGVCTSKFTSPFFSCLCSGGYHGDTCTEQYCAAHPNTCKNRGVCTSTLTSPFFSCRCSTGYYGDTCTERYCAAHQNTCNNKGVCTSTLTSPFFSCRCSTGYYGDKCTERYCTAHRYTCKNRGVCTSTFTSPFFSCRCSTGYYGDTCTERYCAAHQNTCKNRGVCTSTLTSPFFTCRCSTGYYGDTCTERYCTAHRDTCKNSGICTSTFTSPFFSCRCSDGFYGDTCTERYCAAHRYTCKNSGVCTSTLTSPFFSCRCSTGYYGDTCTKRYCNAHRYTCKNRGVCTSTLTSPFFSCRCSTGYYGDTCTERYCTAHENRCKNGGVCTSTFTSPFYSCRCSDGYYGDTCTERYCAAHRYTCKNGGVCTSTFTSPFFSCRCSDGYYGDTCTEQYCSVHQNPCGNGGTCFSETISPFYSCRCDKGYYGKMCAEFLQISTPPIAIGVVGDNILSIGVTVNTTRGGVTLTFFKKNFKKNSTQLIENVTNGDAHFNLYDITKGNRGHYRISAKVKSPTYTTRADFMVIIQENATVKDVNPRFTYSPKTTGVNLITCNATGIPVPDVSWYRAGSLVTNSGFYGGVFQFKTNPKIYESVAYLNVTNAGLSDNGTYLCKATNIVGSDNRTIISKAWAADLAVYGSPTIQNVSPTPCSINGTVEVVWKPNNQTNGVKHRLSLRSLNTTIPHIVSITTIEKHVTFDQLLPLTTYQMQITVCPEECISKLNASTTVKTGVGLPGEVHNPSLHKDDESSGCIVTWNWPKITPSDIISHTEVSWKANKVYRADNNPAHEAMEIHSTNVSSPTLLSNISTVPNRKYSVSVRAFTCAGPGVSVIANGSCLTDAEAPTAVEESTVSSTTGGSFREINIVLPEEGNGRISCVFVIVSEGNSSESNKFLLDEKTLRNSSFAPRGQKPTDGESYIALAVQRQSFANSAYPTVLGDNQTSYCNPAEFSKSSVQRRSSARTGRNDIWGKNWPLLADGTTYSYYTVTTTPTSSGSISFGRSKPIAFVNGQAGFSTLILALIIVGVAVFIILILGVSWRYHKSSRGKADVPNAEYPEENAYENVVLNELRSATTIALSRLQDIYKAMKANDSLQFRENFQELKAQAKVVASPSTIGEGAEMKLKNRYKNIIPYDSTIVKLQGEGIGGYINACHIKGRGKNFIAAQGPLPNTVADFWRMIVEYKVKVIVMLTRCAEARKRKCEKYWPNPGENKQHGDVKVENVKEAFFGGYVRRTLKIVTKQNVQYEVVQFQFVNWPDHGVPSTTSNFFRFHKAVMEAGEKQKDTPLLIHCSAGVGRTGTFIGFDILLHESKVKRSIDIFSCVLDMRKQRVEMVQTSAQYELLHKLLLENYMFGETDVRTDDLAKMELRASSSPVNARIEKEFQNLSVAESLNSDKDENQASSSQHNLGRIVIIRQPEDTEWICFDASRVEAFDRSTDLIAAQGPVKSTLEYFWRAVLDNEVGTIVMLNNSEEGNEDSQTCAVQYWPESKLKHLKLNNITVQVLEEHTSSGICTRELLLSRKNQQQKKITHYQKLAWASNDVPEDISEILSLVSKLQTGSDEKPGAIMIHCSDGLGKTGVFCAILNIIARINAEQRVDVFRAVKDLRDHRAGLVKTLEEYILCYKTAQTYLETCNVYNEVPVIDDDSQIYQNLR